MVDRRKHIVATERICLALDGGIARVSTTDASILIEDIVQLQPKRELTGEEAPCKIGIPPGDGCTLGKGACLLLP